MRVVVLSDTVRVSILHLSNDMKGSIVWGHILQDIDKM